MNKYTDTDLCLKNIYNWVLKGTRIHTHSRPGVMSTDTRHTHDIQHVYTYALNNDNNNDNNYNNRMTMKRLERQRKGNSVSNATAISILRKFNVLFNFSLRLTHLSLPLGRRHLISSIQILDTLSSSTHHRLHTTGVYIYIYTWYNTCRSDRYTLTIMPRRIWLNDHLSSSLTLK